jgi:hypothetical protein
MHRVTLTAVGLLVWVSAGAAQADALNEARRLYNAGQYEAAARAAREASGLAGLADAAGVVLGRIQLERYRQTGNPEDLSAARRSLRVVDPRPLSHRERLELTIGQAEVLYLDDRFGASAELFESSLDRSAVLGPASHERVLDWWATALDRHAQLRPVDARAAIYHRIMTRMGAELALDEGSASASYWLAAAARGAGDLERAWQASLAGWVRAAFAADRGAELRADLDRLVTQAIIPERAALLQPAAVRQTVNGMLNEWTEFKAGWNR